MVDVKGSALRLYRRILGAQPPAGGEHPGIGSATDGSTAVAVTEVCVADAAGLGGSYPGVIADRRFKHEAEREGVNLFGSPLVITQAAGGRGALAAAVGQASAGLRATAFLSSPDLAGARALLEAAAGRRLPLVIHVASQALPGPGTPHGSGHEAWHAVADSGCALLFAGNVQEAVDFSLVARRLAEDALVPVLVATDGAETAFAVQDAFLPSPELARSFLGEPGDSVHALTPAQDMLFGTHRRRVPRWHDLERPAVSGSLDGGDSHALGKAAGTAYFDPHVPQLLDRAFEEFAVETGRRHATLSTRGVKDARLVLVAQGAAVETAEAVAGHVRAAHKIKVGVVGIKSFRPFPAATLVDRLRGRELVVVLERTDGALGAEPPLLREVRSALDRASENARAGRDVHAGLGRLGERERPRLGSAVYGLGGHALRGRDLEALCVELAQEWRTPVFVGLEFSPADSPYPKRQVVLDTLRRNYPDSMRLGVKGTGPAPALSPEGSFTLRVHRIAGRGGEGLAGESGLLLHRLSGGHLRARPAISWERWDTRGTDRMTWAPVALADPGDDAPADLAVWFSDGIEPDAPVLNELAEGGALLVPAPRGGEPVWDSLPARVRRGIKTRGLRLYVFKPAPAEDETREERLLGSVFGVLTREGRLDTNARKLAAAREDMLPDLDPALRETRLAALQAGYDTVLPVETGSLSAPTAEEEIVPDTKAPSAVRRLGRTDEAVDSLPRFWDQVGVLYERGEVSALVPDPYLGTGLLPPRSASFRDLSDSRDTMPLFDPALCTGCGKCWTACPDSVMRPLVLSPAMLIEQGMAMAKGNGHQAEPLRMAVSKIAARVGEVIKALPEGGAALGPVLDEAFEKAMAKMPLNEERKAAIGEAFGHVRGALADLPVARTRPFFDEREAAAAGSGELVTMAINFDGCKGCAVCVAECEPGALTAQPQSREHIRRTRVIWDLVENLPEASAETITYARENAEVGPLAGAHLSRESQLSMAGGDGAEAGAGEKIAVRQVLATSDYHLKPRVKEQLEEIVSLRDSLSAMIREHMADALPTQDLDALAAGLDSFDRPDVDLAGLTSRVEAAFDTGRVDVSRLRRLVEVTRRLADLQFQLERGVGGMGRSCLGVVVAPGSPAAWAASFPHNPFAQPVTVDAGEDTLELARGVLEGQIQEALEGFRAVRWARLELEKPAEAARAREALRALSWRDLTEEERRQVPPVFVVATDEALARGAMGSLSRLLAEDLPIRILALADTDLGLDTAYGPPAAARSWTSAGDVAAWALAHPGAFVLQTSIGHPGHLEAGIVEALDTVGPAVIRIHAPSPSRHGFPLDAAVRRAREAVASRAFPVFKASPAVRADSPLRVSLDGNPDPDADWSGGEAGAPLTPAGWAAGEKRFAAHLRPATEADPDPTPLVEYLELGADERTGKTPVVTRPGADASLVVDEALTRAVELRRDAWRELRERAAGVPEAVVEAPAEAGDPVAAAEAALASRHEAELLSVRQAHEAQMQALRAQLQVEMARKVKGKLLALVARRAGNGKAEE